MTERQVDYVRIEDRGSPEARRAPLWAFLMDLPYFGACGIFPPLHHLNAILKSGTHVGATWEPFELSEEEYQNVLPRLVNPDANLLAQYSRYEWQVFEVDPDLDKFTDFAEWQRRACEKHGQAYGLRMAMLQHELVTGSTKDE